MHNGHMHGSNGVRCVLLLVSQVSYTPITRLSGMDQPVTKSEIELCFNIRGLKICACPASAELCWEVRLGP